MVFCRGCGKEIHESAPVCPHCGAAQKVKPTQTIKVEEPMPDGIKGWSWGAFLLNWIWAIGNKTWIGLLALIPYVNIVMAIILGFKGREWAWKNKQWESVEHFNRVQKKWSFWGVMIVVIALVIGVAAAIGIPAYKNYQSRAEAAAYAKQVEAEQQAEAASQAALQAAQQAQQAAAQQARQAERNADPFGLNEWKSGFGQGVSEYAVHDGNGNGLHIACSGDREKADVSATARVGGVEIDSKDKQFDMVIDGKSYPEPFSTGCRACARFEPFWNALRKAKSVQISVDGKLAEIPTNKVSEILPEYSSKENACVPMEI